jgi:hypothetical protein
VLSPLCLFTFVQSVAGLINGTAVTTNTLPHLCCRMKTILLAALLFTALLFLTIHALHIVCSRGPRLVLWILTHSTHPGTVSIGTYVRHTLTCGLHASCLDMMQCFCAGCALLALQRAHLYGDHACEVHVPPGMHPSNSRWHPRVLRSVHL